MENLARRHLQNNFTSGIYKGRSIEDTIQMEPDYVVHAYLTFPDNGGVTPVQYDAAIAQLDDWGTDSWDYDPDDVDYVAHERHRLRHDRSGGYYNHTIW